MTARDQTLITLWRDNVPVSEIADTLDMTPNAVHGLACRLRSLGHDLPRRTTGPRPAATDRCGTPYEQILAGVWPTRNPEHRTSALQPAAQPGERPNARAPEGAVATALEAR